jgi:hypothetical protein
LPLGKQPIQGYLPTREDTEISMHWKDVFIRLQCLRNSHGNRFLSDPAEPFTDFILPEQNEHFFFNHPRRQDLFVQIQQSGIGQILAVVFHIVSKRRKVIRVFESGGITLPHGSIR